MSGKPIGVPAKYFDQIDVPERFQPWPDLPARKRPCSEARLNFIRLDRVEARARTKMKRQRPLL